MNEYFAGKMQFIWWQGVVEDVDDPLKLGRCRVRILGFHTPDKQMIPTEHLPWASPIQPITHAAMNGIGTSPSGLLTGTWVMGFFRDPPGCQDPIIWGSIAGIPQSLPVPSVGFNDPTGTYPKQDFLNEPDTNRLARNESIEKTIVATKKKNIVSNVDGALGSDTWNEPETPYNAEYPKNRVMETESGHIEEFDDTSGSERIHRYHKAGTFEEIHPSGTVVRKIVTDNYEIILQDDKILIRGTKTENVDGNNNLKVGGNLNIEVVGDANVLIGGNSTLETRGDHFHKIGGVCSVVSDGNMIFMAPRIDFNPNGFSPSDVESPF